MPRPPFPRPQRYAVVQEQLRHDDAVHWFGEMTAFICWWKLADFEAGLVVRCPRCWGVGALGEIAEAYGQASQKECPVCFGTTFEGGIKALVYAPAIWDPTVQSEDVGRRGEERLASSSLQTTSGVVLRDNDTAVRVDNSRWRLAQPRMGELSTGFGFHGNIGELMRSAATANLQPHETVDYRVVVDLDRLDTSGLDQVLIPLEDTSILTPLVPGAEGEGWILFGDTAHLVDTELQIGAGAWTDVPNNGAQVSNNGAPSSATTWWNSTTNRFRPPTVGDMFSLQLSFEAASPVALRELEVELTVGATVHHHSMTVLSLAGVPEHVNVEARVLVDAAMVTSGAAWRMRCNSPAEISGVQLIVRREYRA